VNPKLDTQADGPFQVLENSGHTLLLQQGEMRNRISSDRVTPAPTPHTLDGADPGRPAEAVNNRLPVEETTRTQETPNPAERDSESEPAPQEEEYVVERVVGAKQMRDGTLYYKVGWYGYPSESDTWEPAYHLPENLLRRYHKRTRLPWPRSLIQGNQATSKEDPATSYPPFYPYLPHPSSSSWSIRCRDRGRTPSSCHRTSPLCATEIVV
jgi:hypothetical protein